MVRSYRIACAVSALLSCSGVFAAPINMVAPGSVTGNQLTTFDDIPGGTVPGTNYNGVVVSRGVSFAERFLGQSLSTSGGFDALSGTPSAPLTLQVGDLNQNLNILVGSGSQVLTGLGPVVMGADSFGEGAFAALFSTDQSEFGFDLDGGDGGTATVSFFRRDGSLIDTIVLNSLSFYQGYAFSRDSGVFDIAGISVHNNDLGGIGFDNLRFNVPGTGGTVPEPATLALVGFALAGLRWSRRKA